MRVLICGDREWNDYKSIVAILEKFGKGTIVIHGAARGADSLAGIAGNDLGYEVLKFPAQWDKYGKAAGVIRNQQMLDEGKPDCAVAFHDNIKSSKGTKDMIKRLEKANIKYLLWSH